MSNGRGPGADSAPGRVRRGREKAAHAFCCGDWVPGRQNMALLVLQLVALYQAALRGRDYLTPRPSGEIHLQGLGVVEAAGSLQVWGWLFYVSAAVALLGLAGRWAPVVIAAHAALFAWYGGIGIGLLQEEGVHLSPGVIVGLLVACLGTWVVFRRHASTAPIRLLVGVPAMLLGQELISSGLGQDYRTGTGLIGGGLMHLTIAAGTWLLWKRQHLTAQVELEQGVVLPR